MRKSFTHRIPVALVVWPLFVVTKLLLAIFGLIPCALFAHRDTRTWPRWAWLWGNDEDGGDPGWWQVRNPGWPSWARRLYYTAVRNPVNNWRFYFESPEGYEFAGATGCIEPGDLQVIGLRYAWWWRWSGWKDGARLVVLHGADRYTEMVIGFKLGMGVPGLGFTFQFRPYRKVGA